MPQHLWTGGRSFRVCEVCKAAQAKRSGDWQPPVYLICPGDGDDDGDGRGVTRRRPNGPSGAPRVLERA
jgi:hypothetical protein